MNPATEFQNNAIKRERLEAILRDPVLAEALEILEGEVEPRTDLPVTLANDTVAAHRYHQFAGVYHVTKGLKRLSKLPPPVPAPLRGKPPLRKPKEQP